MQLPQRQPRHVRPFIREDLATRSLHFSLAETQSRMNLLDPFALDLEYTQLMMGFLLFVPDPKRIAMIGLGGGSLAKFCHRHLPRTRVDVVEINPHVIEMRKSFLVPRDDRRFRVVQGDGARFVAVNPGCCDVLMVDGYDYDGLPGRLCSKRFFDDARRALRPGGCLVANLHAGHPQHAVHLELLRGSFDGDALAVCSEVTHNCIVFARQGGALVPARGASTWRTRAMPADAAHQLREAFAEVVRALAARS